MFVLLNQVTFDPAIKAKTVTLEGDVFDPAGTLSGGGLLVRSPFCIFMINHPYLIAMDGCLCLPDKNTIHQGRQLLCLSTSLLFILIIIIIIILQQASVYCF